MKFIDSNVICTAFLDSPKRDKCRDIISEGGVINTLVMAEVLHVLTYHLNTEFAQKVVKTLFKNNFQIVPVDANVIFESLKDASRLGLKSYDLIHHTTAKMCSCEAIVSLDSDFNNCDIPRITV